MGNDPSKPSKNSTGMGSRANSTGMGRRSTSSFTDDFTINNTNLRSGASASATPAIPRNLAHRSVPGNQSGPYTADLLAVLRTVFVDFSHADDKNSPASTHEYLGRVEIELFPEVKKASEQFYYMCSGEKGTSSSGHPLHFKNTIAHRIIPGFLVCQAGDVANRNGTGKDSLYPGEEVEKEFPGRSAKHFPYCVACAHDGKHWSSQFYILSGKSQGTWLNEKHQVFGRVVAGEEICDLVESFGKSSGQIDGCIFISNCGETDASKKRQQDHVEREQRLAVAMQVAESVGANNNNNNNGAVATAAVNPPPSTIRQQLQQRSSLPPAKQMPRPTPNHPNDFIWFEFSNRSGNGAKLGVVVIELFTAALPHTAENFRVLASGEKSDYRLKFKGTPVHRIQPGFCVQMGDCEKQTGSGGTSIYPSRYFNDEGYLPHFEGCVATAVSGPNKNNSQFYILTNSDVENQRLLDGRDVVFGRVVNGWSVVKKIESQHSQNFIISNCGVVDLPEIQSELGSNGAPQMPPVEAYAYWHTHPRNRPAEFINHQNNNNNNGNDDDDNQHHHHQVAVESTSTKNNNNTNQSSSSSSAAIPVPNGPNGIINPPFVRAFDNGVLPAEMQVFIQDFLRIIECSVCLSTFDSFGRLPCTLSCGHSICYSHLNLLQNCPLCREEITGKTKIKPNFVLRDICAKFAPTDVESMAIAQKPQERAKTPPRTRFSNLLATTESNRLDLNAPVGPSFGARSSTPDRSHLVANNSNALITSSVPGRRTLVLSRNGVRTSAIGSAAANNNNANGAANYNNASTPGRHVCPLGCDIMRSQRRCCACMDRRPMRAAGTYEVYVDGRGHQNTGNRWDYYCPQCKITCERIFWTEGR